MLPTLELVSRDPFAHPDALLVKRELEACFKRIALRTPDNEVHFSGQDKDVINYKGAQPSSVYIFWMGVGTEQQRINKGLAIPIVANVTLEKYIPKSSRLKRLLGPVNKGVDAIFSFFSRYGNEFYKDEDNVPVLEVNILFAPIVQLLENLEKVCWFSINYVDADKVRVQRREAGKAAHVRESYLNISIVLKDEHYSASGDYDFVLTLSIRCPKEVANVMLKAKRKKSFDPS